MAKTITGTIEFEGNTYEYNVAATKSYKVLKSLATAAEEPARLFSAFDIIFNNKADEYAESLGDSVEKLSELMSAIIAQDAQAKN